MLRISLIIAIIAGLAAAGLNFYKVREVMVNKQAELDTTKQTLATTEGKLSETEQNLTKTTETLKKTEGTLATTEANLKQTSAKLASTEKKAETLSTDLDRTKGERDAAQQELSAWAVLGLPPDKIRAMMAELDKTKEQRDATIAENQLLDKKRKQLQARLAIYEDNSEFVELPRELKGKVIAVDPKFDFVVVDIGGNSNVLERGEMLVNRNGKLIGKIRISAVQPTQSIGNIDPAWKREEIVEGDQVIARIK